MKKKAILIGLIAIVICLCGLLLVMKSIQSPYDYLKKNTGSSNATLANEFLYQSDIGKNEFIIFYINGNNNLSCAIMKKTLFFYSIIKISSEVFLVNEDQKADFLFSSYNKGHNWIDWGVVRDFGIKQVLVNDREANLVDINVYSFRIFYLLGDESEKALPPDHELID